MYSFSCIIPPFYYILYYPRRAWAATGIVVCLFVTRGARGRPRVQQSVSLFVCSFESAHLAAVALRLQHGQPSHNKLKVADFDVKASLSNKSEQKLRSLNQHVDCQLATRGLYSRHSNYCHVELLDSGLLCWLYCEVPRCNACEPGVLLVTLQASSGSAGMLLTVQDSQCMSGALFVYTQHSSLLCCLLTRLCYDPIASLTILSQRSNLYSLGYRFLCSQVLFPACLLRSKLRLCWE